MKKLGELKVNNPALMEVKMLPIITRLETTMNENVYAIETSKRW